MLLTLTTTHTPATDLGYLLHKNPEAVRSVEMWFGRGTSSIPRRRTSDAPRLCFSTSIRSGSSGAETGEPSPCRSIPT